MSMSDPSEVIVPDQAQIDKAMEDIKKLLGDPRTKKLEEYSLAVKKGDMPVDTCPDLYGSKGGSRKNRTKRKKGGAPPTKKRAAAEEVDAEYSSDTSNTSPPSGGRVQPINNWDQYDYAAAAYIIVMGGGIKYLGGISVLFNAAADYIASTGGLPTQASACDPSTIIQNLELGKALTGMMSCEEVQQRYTLIVSAMVTGIAGFISTIVASNAREAFAGVNWTNMGDVLRALATAGHTSLAKALRNAATVNVLGSTLTYLCSNLKKWLVLWGAPGSKTADLPSETSSQAPTGLGEAFAGLACSGSGPGSPPTTSGGRRRRRRRTRKTTKRRNKNTRSKRKYKTKKK